jgi:hypothetical protein
MLHRNARPERLLYEADKVDYCNFAILERDGRTRQWSVHFPQSAENPFGGQRPIQSSIPLYRASSHSILADGWQKHRPYVGAFNRSRSRSHAFQ